MLTSGLSNLTTGRIAATHRWFSGIHHVALVCTQPNTCFLGPSRVQIPNGISIGSAVFAQMTAECRYTLQQDAPSPQNYQFPWGIWSPSNTWFAGPTRVLNPKGIFIGSAVFCRAHYCDRQTDRQTTLLGQ